MKNTLAERILSRAKQDKPALEPPPKPVTPYPRLHPLELEQPKNQSEPRTLDQEAAAILAELHPGPEPLPPSHWLELAELARLSAVATFPPERQHNALKSYLASCCEGQPAQLIAAHAVALYLWARRGRAVPIGHCQDAACIAVGLEPDSILWQIPIKKRGRR